MQKIISYIISWRPHEDLGSIHLGLEDGTGASLEIDSAAEGSFLLSLLRDEAPCYYDPVHQLIASGIS